MCDNANVVLGLPRSVFDVVSALCGDYSRRADYEAEDEAVRSVNRTLNNVIDGALVVIDIGMRDIIFSDLISGKGYRKSRAAIMCGKGTYYRQKKRFVKKIAEELHLI